MGSAEKAQKGQRLVSFSDETTSYSRCTKKTMFHHHQHQHQFQFQFSSSSSSINGGGDGASAASGLICFDSASPLTGDVMGSEKAEIFKLSQGQESVRNDSISNTMMSSTPVHTRPKIQSNKPVRFSAGLDPEPGRCRRTDGKKWRCSRNVLPDQKYCERHAHKGKQRRPRIPQPINSCNSHQFPDDNQHRCIDWFAGVGNTMICDQQKQELIPTPAPLEFDLYRPELAANDGEQIFVNPNPYVDSGICNTGFLRDEMMIHPEQISIEKDYGVNDSFPSSLSYNNFLFSDTNMSFSPFGLPLPGWSGSGEDTRSDGLSLGASNSGSYHQSSSSSSSVPGGPLAEALCLGNGAENGKGNGNDNGDRDSFNCR